MIITILPYPSFPLSAHVLSSADLGEQRSYGFALLRTLAGSTTWMKYSRMAEMWKGHEPALLHWLKSIVLECDRRGYDNEMDLPIGRKAAEHWGIPEEWSRRKPVMPPWLGWERLHSSHRSYLIRTDRRWYAQFRWAEYARYDIVWPGRMPWVGGYLFDPKNHSRILLVQEATPNGFRCVWSGTTETRFVRRVDIYRGKWRRAEGDFN